ncbi:MAG: hypothetical protein LAT56_09825 [Wenzhouxiangella sp.]|nr:hypothetical protein [Wenzhouxiangella sp.]
MAASLSAGSQAAPLLLLGASGPIGSFLLERLAGQGVMIMAVSRRQPAHADNGAIWLQHDMDLGPAAVEPSVLVSLGPIRHALAQVEHGHRLGRVIALSSASTLFKTQSRDPVERDLMAELIELEQALEYACARRDIALTLLKPTMIYGGGKDRNVSRIGGLVARLGAVPYCGRGLRQPVHADDLAKLIVHCLKLGRLGAGKYLLGGGETLSYPELLRRIASARGRRLRLIRLPAFLVRPLLRVAHGLGHLTDIRPAMIDRQAMDLVVDDQPARERLDWHPRPFRP